MSDNGALALASILHDTYGCRITCRSGRLANDRHPSHAEAYLDTATAVLASLDAAGWALVRDAGNPLADREQAATIATLRAQYAAQLNRTIEANSTIATLRAALDGLVEAATQVLLHGNVRPFAEMSREQLRAALASAKEAGG